MYMYKDEYIHVYARDFYTYMYMYVHVHVHAIACVHIKYDCTL